MAAHKRSDRGRSVPPSAARPGMVARFATERVPEGVEFTGVLRTAGATPMTAALGVMIGLGSFVTLIPLAVQALAGMYWLATGRPGPFADTYKLLAGYQVPFGMVTVQLSLALLIPIAAAVILTIHHVHPSYLFSVRPGLRWRPLLIFAVVALVTLNGVLWITNAIMGKPFVYAPQAGFAGFLVAILLTSPLQAAAEEVFFRGYLLQALGSLSASRWPGILASAGVFALFHGTQNAWLFASRFAFGVLAAVLVVFVGGLEAGIAAHIVNNVCAFAYAGLSAGGIAALKATTEVGPVDAVAEIVMYAVFTAAALVTARVLGLQVRTGLAGLGQRAALR